jgi:heme-degrading monooxygenase HmoA
MHVLVIEGGFKQGKKDEFVKAWADQLLPTLKKQPGFVDEILLSGNDPQEGAGLSFWKSKADAERYQREVFPLQVEKVKQFLSGSPSIRSFNVEAAETFRVFAGKAA